MPPTVRGEALEIDWCVKMPLGLALKFVEKGICCGCLDDRLVTEVCSVCGLDHGPILDAQKDE